MRIILFEGKKILDQAGLLVDDGQRIVDFMGHAGSQSSDGGHLVGILHLV